MRIVFLGAIVLGAVVTAAAATETPRAGAYASLTTADAAACARACADDGICMAWSFHRENQCELSAVVLAPSTQALATGFAQRAPAYLRPRAPIVGAAPATPRTIEFASSEEAPPPEPPPDDGVLLGGPEEGDLRLGLH
jgi:hypothetical protein